MWPTRSLAVLGLVAACSDPEPPVVPEVRTLGMNDVSILVPLPVDLDAPVIAKLDHTSPTVLPLNLVTSLAIASEIGPKGGTGDVAYDDFHIVSLRFDPCPRDHFGATCTDGDDGRLRLILQPLHGEPIAAHDIALHAFYPIPAAELPEVIDELRELAAMQDAPLDSPLKPSPALVEDPRGDYAIRLRALVERYARSDNLVQLTTIGQEELSAAFAWIFAGFTKQNGAWTNIAIPALPVTALRQQLRVGGGDTVYESEPSADFPFGLTTAANGTLWAQASDEEKRIAIEALAEIENPTRHDATDSQCMGCHISTYLSVKRSAQLGVDPATRAREYTTPWNTAVVDSFAVQDARVVRAFGYADSLPAISRRVANDTAFVLDEIEKRWPSAVR